MLARRIERGDLAAKRELVEANLKLGVFVASGFARRGVVHMGLVQEASRCRCDRRSGVV